jgi:DNA-binding PadR family transcriptional regulator
MSVRYALLGLIAQQPRHGYDLHSAFTAIVGGEQNWEVKPAQVYTTLSRLQEGGFIKEEGVEQSGGPEKHIYTITPTGLEDLRNWLVQPVEREHGKDEFFVKIVLCIATGEQNPIKVIYAQRANLFKELHYLNNKRAAADPKSQLAHIFLLEKAIMHTEADLRWLDMIEGRIDEIRKQPLPLPEQKQRGRPAKQK